MARDRPADGAAERDSPRLIFLTVEVHGRETILVGSSSLNEQTGLGDEEAGRVLL